MSLGARDLFSLEQRTAVVTGAGGFLGRGMVEALLANGARVLALGRSASLDEAVDEWSVEHGADRVAAHRVDLYDTEAFAALLDEIAAREPVHVLVNNAHEMGPATGFNVADGFLENGDPDQWRRNLEGGGVWPALAIQRLGAGMRERRTGSIVNISSMYGVVAPAPALYEGRPFVNPAGYSMAKAAMLGLTRYVASFWGRDGVRCNAILPGPFSNTESDTPNAVTQGDPFLDRLAERTCLGRVGKRDELAGALVFLASDASSFVTGQTLVVDGGWTTT